MATSKAFLLAVLLVVSVAAPAVAKCCPLDHLVIKTPGGGQPHWIDGRDIEKRLPDWARGLLTWPVFYGVGKGNEPPEGKLGRSYLAIYVHEAVEGGRVVRARERIYPAAEGGPIAFTLPGQTQEFFPGDERRVPAGWRPVEEEVWLAIVESDPVKPLGPLTPLPAREGGVRKFAVGVVRTLTVALLLLALGWKMKTARA